MRTFTAILLLYGFSAVAHAAGLTRCECTYENWEGDCSANIKMKNNWITITSSTSQCSRVDWYSDGDPHVTIVTDGVENEEWLGQTKTPKLSIDSCKICRDNQYSNTSKNIDSQPSKSELNNAVITFYNNQGEWAGIFRIGSIDNVRLENSGPNQLTAHVKYFYVPIPGNYKNRTDTGYDQRTFTLIKNKSGWSVVGMGGYMSAHF